MRTIPITRTLTYTLAALLLVVAGCSESQPSEEGEQLQIVATTGIWGDVTENVATDGPVVSVLIPSGQDPHDYQASAQQLAQLITADLVVANGLDLEEGLSDVLEAARDDGANVLFLGESLDPLAFASSGEGLDPHVWMDARRVAVAAGLIADALNEIDPDARWGSAADNYASELQQADSAIELALADVTNRALVTNHDALGYFADAYEFEIIGTVIPGGSTMGDPSSAEVAALVDVISATGVPAIFAESTEPATLAETIASEVGDVAVVELYTGSLGEPGSDADSLIGMLMVNAERIAGALSE